MSSVLCATHLIPLPDTISDRVAGSAMLRGLTAHMILFKVSQLRAGDWILVHSAAGGLGQLLTRWARQIGLRVIGTVGSSAKVETAQTAGAHAVLLHSEPSWQEKVREIADGKGVHLAVDGIGGPMPAQTLRVVRPFGTAVSLGQPAGPTPAIDAEQLGPRRSIALARPSVLGYTSDPALYRQGTTDLFAALHGGLINPIGAEYPLSSSATAQADLEAGRTTGSVILIA